MYSPNDFVVGMQLKDSPEFFPCGWEDAFLAYDYHDNFLADSTHISFRRPRLLGAIDSYPSWSKFKTHPERQKELREQVDQRLTQIASRYHDVIAFVNVRAYYECLESLSRKYEITVLPRAAQAYRCSFESSSRVQSYCVNQKEPRPVDSRLLGH